MCYGIDYGDTSLMYTYSNLIKLYKLNMYSFLYVNHTIIPQKRGLK